MQHVAQAHLHLPDALLSFWRADVLTSHASTSSALFYCFTETWLQREVPLACDTPTGSVLHTATRTDASLKLLQFVTILLQHIHCTLVLRLYSGLLLQYSGVFIWVFCKGNAHHVLLSGDQQFQFISFQTCFHSVMEWKADLLRGFTGSYFAKFLTCRIKKHPDFGLET